MPRTAVVSLYAVTPAPTVAKAAPLYVQVFKAPLPVSMHRSIRNPVSLPDMSDHVSRTYISTRFRPFPEYVPAAVSDAGALGAEGGATLTASPAVEFPVELPPADASADADAEVVYEPVAPAAADAVSVTVVCAPGFNVTGPGAPNVTRADAGANDREIA